MRDRAAFLLTMIICSLAGCTNAQRPVGDKSVSKPDQKILIVYLSRTNNTKAVAEFIHDEVGGTLVPIELEKPYPENYRATVDQVVKENETGFLPPLKTKIDNFDQYDIVFVGFPTWDMKIPPPMKSFLRQYSFKGKTVIPFNMNAGYGEGDSFATLKELCPGSNVLDGFVTTGGIEKDGILLAIKGARAAEVKAEVRAWLKRIKLLQRQEEK
jgi:Flavodoxins